MTSARVQTREDQATPDALSDAPRPAELPAKRVGRQVLYDGLHRLEQVRPAWSLFEAGLVRLAHLFPSSARVRQLCYHAGRAVALWRPSEADRIAVLPNGARVSVTLKDFWYHGHLYFDGGVHIHYPEASAWLQRLLGPGDVFLDVGAHIGYFSCLAAGQGAVVHAFEPHPDLAQRLRRSRDLNQFGDRLHVNQQAVAAENGSGELFIPDDRGDESGGSLLPLARFEDRVAIRVERVTLDSYCQEHNITSIRLLHLDAQGAELEVLAGARRMLSEIRPYAILCFVPGLAGGNAPGEVVGRLREAGYVPYDMTMNGLQPLSEDASLRNSGAWRMRLLCFMRA